MKKSTLVFALAINLFFPLASFSQTAYHVRLEWNEFYKLTWEDFQGKPSERSYGDAATAVQIKAKPFRVDNEIFYDVFAYFNREQSWKRDVSAQLLEHEQLHFDIAELYARKIRREITHLKAKNINDVSTINAAIREILEESNRVDLQYDAETLHGSLLKKQSLWNEKVKNELASLDGYKREKRVIGLKKTKKRDQLFASR